jgi:hypothetical protein
MAALEGPVRIRDMPWDEFRKLLASIGPEIGKLAVRADPTARLVMEYYKYAFDHPTDAKANLNLRTAVEDYVNRDLRTAEQIDLGGKYGHRLPEPEKETGPRIFVPGGGES